MICYNIVRDGESLLEIEFPESASDITLKQMLDFEKYLKEETPEWFQQLQYLDSVSDLQEGVFYYHISKLISIVTGVNIDVLLGITEDSKFEESDDDFKSGLIVLYLNLLKIINGYKPKEFIYKFFYKGSEYILPKRIFSKITGRSDVFLTTLEGILMSQYIHTTSKYEDKSLGTYHRILLIISVLCRKKGEKLITDDDQALKEFTEERFEFFKDLSMDIGLDVWFFFLNSLNLYKVTITGNMPLSRFMVQQAVLNTN